MVRFEFPIADALLATRNRRPLDELAEVIPHHSYSFVGVPYLTEKDAQALRAGLPSSVKIAAVMPAIVAGASHGHFKTLLDWQPKVDKRVTRLVAIIAPGPWNRTAVEDSNALLTIASALKASGYDAIAIRCKAGDDAEFIEACSYAEDLGTRSQLPIYYVSQTARSVEGTAFSMRVTEI